LLPYLGNLGHLTPSGCTDGCFGNETIATLQVPDTFGPTATGRSWLVSVGDCPAVGIAAALPLAIFLTVLFFFDHNVSSILCQAPEFGLRKGSAYHWDFFVVGFMIFVTGMLGLPPVNGLIPQAPLHTDSLCEKVFQRENDSGRKVEVVAKCHEQRVSGLAQAVLIGLTLTMIHAVGKLPIASLDGLFLFMGIASFGGNTFYERLVLFFTDKQRRHARSLPFLGHSDGVANSVPMKVIRRFTLLQLAVLLCIYGVTRMPFIDGFFPMLIAVLVPVRIYVLPRLFGEAHVKAMDGNVIEPSHAEEAIISELRMIPEASATEATTVSPVVEVVAPPSNV
jgi:boron transporter